MSTPIERCPSCDRPVANEGVCPACSLRLIADEPDEFPDREEIEALIPDWEVLDYLRDHEGIRATVRHRQSSEKGQFRFLRAARAGQTILESSEEAHPNLLRIFEAVSEQGYRYEIREFFDGMPLPEAVRSGSVSRKQIITEVIPQLQSLLGFARTNGLPMGVDPGTVRIDETGNIKVSLREDLESKGKDMLAWTQDLGAAGTRIGDYELRRLLGEGGFAEVYLAEQRGEIHRTVALKILKPGMDTGEVLVRFEAERQALARLSHPGIATIYDAGITDEGRPFFVMEYVPGESLTEHVSKTDPGLNDKLELFRKICVAIQHAHEHGIIHRDLKPSNILVMEVAKNSDAGSVPSPKIIDFGIAKATGDPLTQRTLHTRFYHLVGSLGYMSPEQASMKSDVDARADVYALGCVLFELLTGRTPLGRNSSEVAPIDALTRIRDDLPLPPSKQAPPGKRISRDLDAVVMKALEKNPQLRYESVEKLGADVGRVLAGEAVSVRAPGVRYRLRRMARDRSARAALSACAGAVIVAALAAAIWPTPPQKSMPVPSQPLPIHFVAKSRTADGMILPISLWDFDGNFENEIEGGPPIRVMGEPLLEFQSSKIAGEVAQVLSFPKFLVTEYLTADNPIGPNGWDFATETNEYTLVMDVLFPSLKNPTALMQASVGNTSGCELAILEGGVLSSKQHRGKRITEREWVRIALAVSARGTSQLVRLWIDGEPAGPTWPQGRLDSHMSLDEEIHFFADGDGYTGSGLVSSIALYDVVLTEGEVAALGSASAQGIPPQLQAVPGGSSEPDVLQLADAVIAPPEPGRELPTYNLSVSGNRVVVSQAIGRGASGGIWLYDQESEGSEWHLRPLVPPDTNVDGWSFGFKARAHGDWVAVAAIVEPVDGHAEAGAVHLYHKSGGQWKWAQRLVSADPAASNVFGQWFSMSDDLIVIAEARKAGKKRRANVYERVTDRQGEESWKLARTLDGSRNSFGRAAAFPDAETIFLKTGDRHFALLRKEEAGWHEAIGFNPGGNAASLGYALSCDRDTLLVGWTKPQSNEPGEVLIFRRHEGGTNAWGNSGKISAPLSCRNPSDFGVQVAIEGARAVIAERSPDRKTAIIHQFERVGFTDESWREIAAPLVIPDINGFSINTRFAAASSSFEGGRVPVFDLERWRAEAPVVPTPEPVTLTPAATFTGSFSGENAQFGYGLARQGDTAIVGAYGEESRSGAAYVFVREEGKWIEKQRLVPSDAGANGGASFGADIDVDGDFAVIQAPKAMLSNGVKAGAAYVFHRDSQNGRWREAAKLVSGDPQEGGNFGNSGAIVDDVIALGASGEGAGKVYVFERGTQGPGDWRLSAKMAPRTTEPQTHYGMSVDLDGKRLSIGARNRHSVGFAELFERSSESGEWARVVRLNQPGGEKDTQFGYRVDVEGDLLAIGARTRSFGGRHHAGSVYLYEKEGGNWELVQAIISSKPANNSLFTFCRLFGGRLYVGERGNGGQPGAFHIFDRKAGGTSQWDLVKTVLNPAGAGVTEFGRHLALDGNSLLVSEPFGGERASGRVHHYHFDQGSSKPVKPKARPEAAQILQSSVNQPESAFGCKIAISGDEAIIGASQEPGPGGQERAGAAYIFARSSDGKRWEERQQLVALDAEEMAYFGGQVDLDGDLAVVQARHWLRGDGAIPVAYVFRRDPATGYWNQEAKLIAPGEPIVTKYNMSRVAVSGNTVVLSSTQEGAGAVYVYDRVPGDPGGWKVTSRIVSAANHSGANFGIALRLKGNRILIGARSEPKGIGSATLFEREAPGSDWKQIARFEPPTSVATRSGGDQFGWQVEFDRTTVAIGAREVDSVGVSNSGAVYLYEERTEGWKHIQTLVCPELKERQWFSYCRIVGDKLFVGEQGDKARAGAVWVFGRNAGESGDWGLLRKIEGTSGKGQIGFGRIDCNEDWLLIGEYGGGPNRTGQVYCVDLRQQDGPVDETATIHPTRSIQVTSPNPATQARFGNSVALRGDTAVIGAYWEGKLGAAYVFERDAGEWAVRQRLFEREVRVPGDVTKFGMSVALGEDFLIVGDTNATLDNKYAAGAAYAYQRNDRGQWEKAAVLTRAGEQVKQLQFGSSLSIDGNTVAIGSAFGEHAPEVHLFKHGGTPAEWKWAGMVKPEPGESGHRFGDSVSLSGDELLVGVSEVEIRSIKEENAATGVGYAALYRRTGDGAWKRVARFTPPDGRLGDRFGHEVALGDGVAAIAATHHDLPGRKDAGAIYLYARNNNANDETLWTLAAKLVPGPEDGPFNTSNLSFEGDRLIFGAASVPGSIYSYRRDPAGHWRREMAIHSPSGEMNDRFGSSVAIDGGTVLVGAGWDGLLSRESGAAYFFELPGDGRE